MLLYIYTYILCRNPLISQFSFFVVHWLFKFLPGNVDINGRAHTLKTRGPRKTECWIPAKKTALYRKGSLPICHINRENLLDGMRDPSGEGKKKL